MYDTLSELFHILLGITIHSNQKRIFGTKIIKGMVSVFSIQLCYII